MTKKNNNNQGFTLIELSIVLVIIGLIVGGILVGRDLISASLVRAQITQTEKFNQAANTFRGKYGSLPGDIPDPAATSFGFAARGGVAGQGDGNGVIEGNDSNAMFPGYGPLQSSGETVMFWVDLSKAGLIDGSFSAGSSTSDIPIATVTASSTPNLYAYFPTAKISSSNFVQVWSGGWSALAVNAKGDGNNYFAVAQVNSIAQLGKTSAQSGMTVQQAYSIDKKIDDGFPQSGNVLALYVSNVSNLPHWAANGGNFGQADFVTNAPSTTATSADGTTCYDNSGSSGTQQLYSLKTPTMVNCALSVKLQ